MKITLIHIPQLSLNNMVKVHKRYIFRGFLNFQVSLGVCPEKPGMPFRGDLADIFGIAECIKGKQETISLARGVRTTEKKVFTKLLISYPVLSLGLE